MDFFGIGPLELLVIFLIAFLILGPQRFMEMARTTGKFIHNLRRMGSQLTTDILDFEEPPKDKDKAAPEKPKKDEG